MLEQEKYQLYCERGKGFGRFEPNSFFVRSGARKRLIEGIFTVGRKLD